MRLSNLAQAVSDEPVVSVPEAHPVTEKAFSRHVSVIKIESTTVRWERAKREENLRMETSKSKLIL